MNRRRRKSMGQWFAVLLLLPGTSLFAADPVVDSVSFSQRPGTKLVDITYTVSDADEDDLLISVSGESNGEAVPMTDLSGDGAAGPISPGTYTLTWDAENDFDGEFDESFAITLTANDETGLIAYYPFDGNTNDASGNERHGNVAGEIAPTVIDGVIGQAYSFHEAEDGYITTPVRLAPRQDNALSVVCWIRVSIENKYSSDGDTGTVWGRMKAGGREGVKLGVYSSHHKKKERRNKVEFNGRSETYDQHKIRPLVVNDGNWHMIAVVWDRGDCTMYVDTGLAGTIRCSYDLDRRGNVPIFIGAKNNEKDGAVEEDRLFRGDIDEVRFYSRALSIAEIRELFGLAQ